MKAVSMICSRNNRFSLTVGLFLAVFLLSGLGLNAQENNCEVEVSKKSQKLYKRAIDDLRYGRYSEATESLQQAIDNSPDFLKALWVLADINRRPTNRVAVISTAIDAYNQIIEICPSYKDYYSYFYLGGIYYNRQEYGKAYKAYQAFLDSGDENIREEHFEEAETFARYAKFYDDIYKNKVPFDPHVLHDVSTADDEYLAVITPDGEYIYFTRRSEEIDRTHAYTRADNRVERFSRAKRIGTNRFEKGAPMPLPFNTQTNEGGATLTIDNKDLYYTRCIIRNRKLDCNICYSHYSNGKWSNIVTLGPNVNTDEYWESMPTISSDGKTMYFVSNRLEDSYGGYDIYKTVKDETGKWQPAVNLGPTINTPGNEKAPFIHTDSQTLYFSSSDYRDEDGKYHRGHMGLGGYDIFYSRMDSTGKWSKPKNIGYPINTPKNDIGFTVSTDGKYGYFASNKVEQNKEQNKERNFAQKRAAGPMPINIYSFELYREARPQKVVFVKGNVRDEETKEVIRDAKVYIQNVETREIKEIPIDRETGDFVAAIVTPNDLLLTVKKSDYAYQTTYIEQKKTQEGLEPLKIDFKLKQIRVGAAYDLQDIYFDTDSDHLKSKSIKVIEGFYDFLKDNPNIKVEIQGHTDNVGSDAYNMKLSEARAKAVYDVLLRLGIPASQMTYKGYGESKPVASNATEAGRAKNRRTVFLITDK